MQVLLVRKRAVYSTSLPPNSTNHERHENGALGGDGCTLRVLFAKKVPNAGTGYQLG